MWDAIRCHLTVWPKGDPVEFIDYEQAWAYQEDLERQAATVEHFETIEKLAHNAGYGFARILKAYASYPQGLPVEAVIPHGVYLNPTRVMPTEVKASLPAVLNYPAYRAQAWREYPDRTLIPSASPFLYALEMFKSRYRPREDREGTLFFAAHSIAGERPVSDWDRTADELLALDPEFQPVTVCLHMRDYALGLHKLFRDRGFDVVSAGRVSDQEFIFRWLHLLSRHRYASSNDLGSAVIYAVGAGVPVFLSRTVVAHAFEDPALLVLQGIAQSREELQQARELRERIVSLFREDGARLDSPLRETVDYLLGAENFKSPEGLLADLEYAASLASRT